jgi:hypothetical protein
MRLVADRLGTDFFAVPAAEHPLGIGDRPKITVYERLDSEDDKWGRAASALRGIQQRPELSGEYAVQEHGTISVPLLSPVPRWFWPKNHVLIAGAHLDEISIFSQPWFVDIAYRKEHRVAKAFNKAGKLICAFPYCQTNVMGIFPRITSLDNWRRLSSFVFLEKHISDEEKRDAISDIIKQLPRSIGYCQFILDDDSGIIRDAFIKAGFECIKVPKYIRSPSKQNYERVDAYAQARDSVLKTISKDGRNRYKITVRQAKIENISTSDFCKFYESNLISSGEQSYAPLSIAETLIENGVRRQKAFTLAVKDKDGIEAAAAFLFDSGTLYAWLASRKYHPRSTKFSGDNKYKKYCIDILVIEAMIFAELHGLIYDAEIIPVERNGAPRNPHKVFVNEKILHLSKKESRFLFERMGWWYHGARQVFCKTRDVFCKAPG